MNELEKYLTRIRANRSTYTVYKSVLTRFLKTTGMTAEEFLEFARENKVEARHLIESFLIEELRQGKAPKYLTIVKSIITGFLKYYDIYVKVELRTIKNVRTNLDYIPSTEEVYYLVRKAHKSQIKAATVLIAFAGMRPIDVVKLRFENIMEDIAYDQDRQMYKPKRIPMKIIVRQSKTGQFYVTFLGPRGAEILCHHLTELSRKLGRPLKPGDELFQWVSVKSLLKEITRLIELSGLRRKGLKRFRPYSLRKYFRRAAMKLGEDVAEFMMGHVKGLTSLSAVYSGLSDFDEQAIEKLRQDYAKIVPELEGTSVSTVVPEELRKLEQRVRFLENVLGVLTKLHPEDLEKVIRYAKLLQAKREYEELMAEEKEFENEIAPMVKKFTLPEATIRHTS